MKWVKTFLFSMVIPWGLSAMEHEGIDMHALNNLRKLQHDRQVLAEADYSLGTDRTVIRTLIYGDIMMVYVQDPLVRMELYLHKVLAMLITDEVMHVLDLGGDKITFIEYSDGRPGQKWEPR